MTFVQKPDFDFIKKDLDEIKEALSVLGTYSFAEDLDRRMEALGLSSSELARRLPNARTGKGTVTHTAVDNWRKGEDRPNGRERFKVIGMALGMSMDELSALLLHNGYAGLYVKNPWDAAAMATILEAEEPDGIVRAYLDSLQRWGFDDSYVVEDHEPLSTTFFYAALLRAEDEGELTAWFRVHREGRHFVADAKKRMLVVDRPRLASLLIEGGDSPVGGTASEMPGNILYRFMSLYMRKPNINSLIVEGGMPASLRGFLSSIKSGKAVTERFMREKLIAYGLYCNMTVEEIDVLLGCARLQWLAESSAAPDRVVLIAVQSAHARYQLYEYENVCRVTERLEERIRNGDSDELDEALLVEFKRRKMEIDDTGLIKGYCARCAKDDLSPEERDFLYYTEYEDRGLMDYVHDLVLKLTAEGALSRNETEVLLLHTRRNVDIRAITRIISSWIQRLKKSPAVTSHIRTRRYAVWCGAIRLERSIHLRGKRNGRS